MTWFLPPRDIIRSNCVVRNPFIEYNGKFARVQRWSFVAGTTSYTPTHEQVFRRINGASIQQAFVDIPEEGGADFQVSAAAC